MKGSEGTPDGGHAHHTTSTSTATPDDVDSDAHYSDNAPATETSYIPQISDRANTTAACSDTEYSDNAPACPRVRKEKVRKEAKTPQNLKRERELARECSQHHPTLSPPAAPPPRQYDAEEVRALGVECTAYFSGTHAVKEGGVSPLCGIFSNCSEVDNAVYPGFIYTGSVHDVSRLPHGQGTKTYHTGSTLHCALWVNGAAHGEATLTKTNKNGTLASVYRGTWQGGVRDGAGILFKQNGAVSADTYSEGRRIARHILLKGELKEPEENNNNKSTPKETTLPCEAASICRPNAKRPIVENISGGVVPKERSGKDDVTSAKELKEVQAAVRRRSAVAAAVVAKKRRGKKTRPLTEKEQITREASFDISTAGLADAGRSRQRHDDAAVVTVQKRGRRRRDVESEHEGGAGGGGGGGGYAAARSSGSVPPVVTAACSGAGRKPRPRPRRKSSMSLRCEEVSVSGLLNLPSCV